MYYHIYYTYKILLQYEYSVNSFVNLSALTSYLEFVDVYRSNCADEFKWWPVNSNLDQAMMHLHVYI